MSSAYYNEFDKRNAAWLGELIADGLIAPGVVDDRPIQEVRASDLGGFAQCHFFAGIGGWSFALRLAGWPNDLPVWTGSCPCQSFSRLGAGRGFNDPRHLWPIFASLIAECRPAVIFGEQVEAAIGHGWLDLVQGDLEDAGYATWAAVFPAAAVGAPHLRDRLYFVGDRGRFVADADRDRPVPKGADAGQGPAGAGVERHFWTGAERVRCGDGRSRLRRPGSRLVADGLPGRMALLRGAGNAIVPQQAAEFVRAYVEAREGRSTGWPPIATRRPQVSSDRQRRSSE
jgi:DNA (cytosine-5)-methyltransferase 1